MDASLQNIVEAFPGAAGRLAEYLFELTPEKQTLPSGYIIQRSHGSPELGQLLLASKVTRLMVIVGIKDYRKMAIGFNSDYPRMCTLVEKACRQAWAESRKIRLGDTGDADIALVFDRWNSAVLVDLE